MSSEAHAQIFLRDDDIGELTPELLGFMDIFAGSGLPVSYQVIPALLTEGCAAELRGRRTATCKLYEFAQHGLTHEMSVNGRRVFYEFGPERTYQQQLEIIQLGQALLEERLGEHFNRAVFTPPQHKYDRNTLTALKASGVQVLSASMYRDPLRRTVNGLARTLGLSSLGNKGVSRHGMVRRDVPLLELSITVVVDDATTRMQRADAVVAAIEEARRSTPIVGLMFHHAAYKTGADRAFLTELAERLGNLPNASFHLIGDLADSMGHTDSLQ